MDLEGLKCWGLFILVLVSVRVSKDPLYHGQIFKYCFKNVSFGHFLSKLLAPLIFHKSKHNELCYNMKITFFSSFEYGISTQGHLICLVYAKF